MILLLRQDCTEQDLEVLIGELTGWGLEATVNRGPDRILVGVSGDKDQLANRAFDLLPGVASVVNVDKPYKLASRDFRPASTVIELPALPGGVPTTIGGPGVAVAAGPCSVEPRPVMAEIAETLKAHGIGLMRAGAFKPRTSPYSFQGLGVEGVRILREIREAFGVRFVTEVMDTRDVDLVAETADIIQIGARNAQNFSLLKAVGRTRTPVLLKRGIAGTIEELLMSAEYIMSQGNDRIILCERGIRTFERATRNTLDLNAVPLLKQWTHLPVAVDPSHGTGRRELVAPMACAAVAAGADMLLTEIHPDPRSAVSDGAQTLDHDQFAAMLAQVGRVAVAVGRTWG